MADIFDFYVYDDRSIQFALAEPIMLEDKDVTQFRFRIPKSLNGFDMTNWEWWFIFVNPKGTKYTTLLELTDDEDEPDEYSVATYTVGYGFSGYVGSVSFSIEALHVIGENIVNEWHTRTYNTHVIDTLQGTRAVVPEPGGQTGTGLTEAMKQALLQIAQKVAYIDEHGQTYYDALYNALYPPASLVSISAVYTQSGTVYDMDTLDSLKPDLVVTAYYDNQTSAVVTNYTLSGTLEEGSSTITVSYGGKTATFDVTVTHYVWNASLNIENDFVAGTAVSNSYNANYNGYYIANSGRCANCEFGILLEAGYKYTFSFNTTANGKNFGIQTYKATCLTAFENHSSIRDYYNADSGWQSISYQFTPTEDMVFQVHCSVTKASLATSGITDLIISREAV